MRPRWHAAIIGRRLASLAARKRTQVPQKQAKQRSTMHIAHCMHSRGTTPSVHTAIAPRRPRHFAEPAATDRTYRLLQIVFGFAQLTESGSKFFGLSAARLFQSAHALAGRFDSSVKRTTLSVMAHIQSVQHWKDQYKLVARNARLDNTRATQPHDNRNNQNAVSTID